MKKLYVFMLVSLAIVAFTISASSEKVAVVILELKENEIVQESKLPTSVEVIEDEAFEGTALIRIELSDKTVSVGERAFADISSLREIRIPFSTKHISSNAFEGSNRTTITAPANSYARAFARTHGLPFSPIAMLCASVQGITISALSVNRSTEVVETEAKTNFSPETQWRRIEELNITRTEELIANHVQGRAPPMA